MKQFYSRRLLPGIKNGFLVFVFLLAASFASFAQIYKATLTGPAEAPPNASPGTGTATVTINGAMMRVQADFSGLLGTVTASHIHLPTLVPEAGTAGVATQTPTFPLFPLGVTAGSYDQTFNMLLPTSYNPAFLNNATNGGNPATAFATLLAALNARTSYFNIHSTVFPGGEIRGFLVICPTITVTIPDAFALPSGVLPNTVYPAYAPAASLTLEATATGGTGPYSYSWSNGATTASTTVSPTTTTEYTVNVQDARGCPGTASKTVHVMDISGGKKGDKIVVCHKGRNSLTIGADGVADHLGHGDMLGACVEATPPLTRSGITVQETAADFSAKVLNNPSANYFDLQVFGKAGANVQLRVYDLLGRVIETRSSLQPNQAVRVGNSYEPGIYIVELVQGKQKQTLRIVKAN